MSKIYTERMTASKDEGFVVFIIGMRINKLWKIHKWLPIALVMPKMIRELNANPELGLLSQESWMGRTTIMLQYWKSFSHLEAYAKSKNSAHLPAWKKYNELISNNGDVGIWHETYQVKKGMYECFYNNMPLFGLGKAGKHLLVTGNRNTAKSRLNK
ncbi:MAG: DUF4188 domain-containing protein [Methylococcales bacterium]|nr:DUF4188 domain-containing protein [Methylococcales bacterium]